MIGKAIDMPEVLIAVEITPLEALIFRRMRESGIFDIRDGNATLHFSKTGKLLKIEKHLYTAFNEIAS